MVEYQFRFGPGAAGKPVTVYDESGETVATGTLGGTDGVAGPVLYTASLDPGEYVADALDARGVSWGRAEGYSALGTPEQITSQMATYARAFPDVTVTRDASGRVTSITEQGITTTYTRDPAGRVKTITRDGVTKTVTRSANGRMEAIA